jgi:hypothetical protein
MSSYATQIVEDFQSFLEEKAGECAYFYLGNEYNEDIFGLIYNYFAADL